MIGPIGLIRPQPEGRRILRSRKGRMAGRVETVIPWSGGRQIYLLTWAEIGEGRRAAAEHAASRVADVDKLAPALARVFRHPVQRRIGGHATLGVWFEVE